MPQIRSDIQDLLGLQQGKPEDEFIRALQRALKDIEEEGVEEEFNRALPGFKGGERSYPLRPATPAPGAPQVPEGAVPELLNWLLSGLEGLNKIPPGAFPPLMLGRILASPEKVATARRLIAARGAPTKIQQLYPFGKAPVNPGAFEKAAMQAEIDKILSGPFFHGTQRAEDVAKIMREGFDPRQFGRQAGVRFGEPTGVSLSASPEVTTTFSQGPIAIRTLPKMTREEVLAAFPPGDPGPLREAYLKAIDQTSVRFDPRMLEVPSRSNDYFRLMDKAPEIPLRDAIRMVHRRFRGDIGEGKELARDLNVFIPDEAKLAFNQNMAQILSRGGVQGLLQSPRRFAEFELRVLDPRRAIPLEARFVQPRTVHPPEVLEDLLQRVGKLPGQGYNIPGFPERFMRGKAEQLQGFFSLSPGEVTSLSDVYKDIPLSQILGP